MLANLTLLVLPVLTATALLAAGSAGEWHGGNIAPPGSSAEILIPKPGQTVDACQSFHWKVTDEAEQYRLSVGSCRFCADIADQNAGTNLSAALVLPTDGRRLYVTLSTLVNGLWSNREYEYQATMAANQTSCESATTSKIGIYHWDGIATRSISQGTAAIRDLGGKTARITLSARMYVDYNIAQACYEDFSLARAARDPDVHQALAEPGIRTLMITAYDGVSFGDCQKSLFLNPRFYAEANRTELIDEYAEFTHYLYRTFAGTGKRFILSNWEGDNAIYCGAADRYVYDKSFRDSCNEDYARHYYGNSTPWESIEGMRLWHQARWEGIQEGRRRAEVDGLAGVSVCSAPEFSIVRGLHNNGFASVLYDVIPHVPFDYVSYSAYESINRTPVEAALKADLNTIRRVAGADTVILGEIGFVRSLWGDRAVELTNRVLDVALEWGVCYVMQWAAFDTAPGVDSGLFDGFGALTPLGAYYQERFASGSDEDFAAVPPPAQQYLTRTASAAHHTGNGSPALGRNPESHRPAAARGR